ncbi:alpha/beta fold hydrolase [Brachybacterium sacelli]|uniref:Pimeloyl-ACP methyl ester carboxylesterase n=1 Tax=Brachybacterium sacelli TaxID=173364 RepID=A0ABS4X3G7_9MICO|nr:alpha/beta hydrolase [Brachybacterium sacelli]MBP2383008.1 pimeloyl-ACP methyl ester carboxylesterase [Brachybacterium sacelli]
MSDTSPRGGTLRTGDGRGLRTIEHGSGPDLVVCEAGLGAAGASWGAVFDQLGTELRAVAYDRAGYGRSDPAPGPRDLARLAEDLLTVIDGTPHERLVLVGHSWGGPVVRLAAATLHARGHAVAGLVLVDASDELADMYFTRTVQVMNRAQGVLLPVLARAGLLAPLQRRVTPQLPEPYAGEFLAAVSTIEYARTVRAESAHIARGLRALQLDPPQIADVPATVLSGRLAGGLGRRRRDELTAAHRLRAARHEQGRFVAAERSGHVIVASEPELVAQEICRLLS